jgi:aryl-alcohol dehydrogenase-like predicted oxidoreductase
MESNSPLIVANARYTQRVPNLFDPLNLPNTNISVHPLCLGTNVFGWGADEKQSFEVLDAYVAYGGNFLDTADVYSEWKEGNSGGESETIIGKWMKARGNRDKIILATKVAKLTTRRGLSPENIKAALTDSLNRLQTDYVDIYYSHEDDLAVPTIETLATYTDLIQQGKIRYIAASQHKADRLEQALLISKENNLAAYIALQDHYNLIVRDPFESEQAAIVSKYNLSALPFYGLAKGFLTGKYRVGKTVNSIRSASASAYLDQRGIAILDVLDEVAKESNAPIAAIALAWLRSHPGVSTPIASARTVEQLEEIIQIVELSADQISRLNAVSKR